MFGRGQVKEQARQSRSEWSQSLEHLREAASHATEAVVPPVKAATAVAVGAAVPALRRARGAAGSAYETAGGKVRGFTADGSEFVAERARTGSKSARKATRKASRKAQQQATRLLRRAPEPIAPKRRMTGKRWTLLVGGVLVAGAAAGGATALIRRRRAQQAWEEFETVPAADIAVLDVTGPTPDAGIATVSPEAAAAAERTTDLIGEVEVPTPGSNFRS